MADGDARLWHQFRQALSGFLNVLNIVVQVINLTPAQDFAQNQLRGSPDRQISRTKVFTASRRAGGVAMMERSRIPLRGYIQVRGSA
ncbi:hypothetical protein WDV93_18780 [Pantoea ananatis]